MSKIKVATIWLDGCSGCHMSFLDMDEQIIDLAPQIDLVYGPLVDLKEIPEHLDLAIVEGAVSNEHDLERVLALRQRSKFLIALGDCAVSGNVPSMRNPIGLKPLCASVYPPAEDGAGDSLPRVGVPALLDTARPVHEVVKVDLFVQGCPPSAHAIAFVLSELLAGRTPDPTQITRFGA